MRAPRVPAHASWRHCRTIQTSGSRAASRACCPRLMMPHAPSACASRWLRLAAGGALPDHRRSLVVDDCGVRDGVVLGFGDYELTASDLNQGLTLLEWEGGALAAALLSVPGRLGPGGSALFECLDETHHRVDKSVIAVTGDHVTRVCDVGELGGRQRFHERSGIFFGHKLAHPAANKVDRYAHAGQCRLHVFNRMLFARFHHAGHKARIPMPAVAPVWRQPQILRQPREILRTRTVRQVTRNDVRRFFYAGESMQKPLRHETHDLRNTC